MVSKNISKTCSITASKVYVYNHSITESKFARLWPPHAYLPTWSITASKCISKLYWLQHPSASTNLLDHDLDYGLQVYLQTPLIAECISRFSRSWSPSASPNSLNYRLQVCLQTGSIMPSECISAFTQSSFSGAPQIALNHHLQPVQICRV